jgi:hypothetical protein
VHRPLTALHPRILHGATDRRAPATSPGCPGSS